MVVPPQEYDIRVLVENADKLQGIAGLPVSAFGSCVGMDREVGYDKYRYVLRLPAEVLIQFGNAHLRNICAPPYSTPPGYVCRSGLRAKWV